MASQSGVQVTIYLNESDEWHRKPLHVELLRHLRSENVASATALHAVAGFAGRQKLETTHLVDAGGHLPIIITFIDTEEHVGRVMPRVKEMAGSRLIVWEKVNIDQGLG
jgi:PII-like signaling protein